MITVIKNNVNLTTCIKVTKELSPSVFNNIVNDKPMEFLWHSVAYYVLFYIFLVTSEPDFRIIEVCKLHRLISLRKIRDRRTIENSH